MQAQRCLSTNPCSAADCSSARPCAAALCWVVLKVFSAAQATVTTTRTGDETFRVEMSGAVGGKVLAFDVAVALHA